MNKKIALKSVVALFLAVIFANGIGMIFYHYPYWFNRSSNATSSLWRPGAYVLQNKEGSGYHTVDANGYLNEALPNLGGYTLVLGSSHTQGKEVGAGERYTDILNSLLGGSEENLLVYNMSADGHRYNHMVAGFLAAITEFPDSSGVVLEINSTEISYDALKASLVSREYNYKQEGQELLNAMTVLDKLRVVIKENLPFLNLIKNQFADFTIDFDNAFGIIVSDNTVSGSDEVYDYQEYYNAVKSTAELMRNNYGGTIVVLYHPSMELNPDGTIAWNEEKTYPAFKDALEDTGIIFLDTQDAFQKAYDEKDLLPYGFNNTSPGSGHMNKIGHQIVAEELYAVLKEVH